MFNRKTIGAALGLAVSLGVPLDSFADGFWEPTHDETGSRIVMPRFGTVVKTAPLPAAKALQAGDISADRQYVFLGEEGGWQLRPMVYRLEGGRLVHVDDPAGHMDRLADTTPLTEQQRLARERSGGG